MNSIYLVELNMPKVYVNDIEYDGRDGQTIISLCDEISIEIPRFCYHKKLSIAGNCRMCLVEVDKIPKPVASCSQVITDGMKIYTNTEMVKKAREGVMEFLLLNHPLDCPVCDQGGCCDLQDQAMLYGRVEGRFTNVKRAVAEKEMGPLITTFMNRCIHCTRCVRFLDEVAGIPELGCFNTGEHMEIDTCVHFGLSSQLSSNVIDICPVGALTAKPEQYKFRKWETESTPSIDVHDPMCSHINVLSINKSRIAKIEARECEEINECWIADKSRFAYDALEENRIVQCSVKTEMIISTNTDKPKHKTQSMPLAISLFTDRLHELRLGKEKLGAIFGPLTSIETMIYVKNIMTNKFGSDAYECRPHGSILGQYNINTGNAESELNTAQYIMNTPIADIEKSDCIVIIGSTIRYEAPLLGIRIRKAIKNQGAKIYSLGFEDTDYESEYIPLSVGLLRQIANQDHEISKALLKAERPVIIVGESILRGEIGYCIEYLLQTIASKCNIIRDNWNGYNLLPSSASIVGGIDIGATRGEIADIDAILDNSSVLMLFGTSTKNLDYLRKLRPDHFVVYFGNAVCSKELMQKANLIFPSTTPFEQEYSYMNAEGRLQRTGRSIHPKGDIATEWWWLENAIKNMPSKNNTTTANYGLRHFPANSDVTLGEIRNIMNETFRMNDDTLGKLRERRHSSRVIDNELIERIHSGNFDNIMIEIDDGAESYYKKDPISENSPTMNALIRNRANIDMDIGLL